MSLTSLCRFGLLAALIWAAGLAAAQAPVWTSARALDAGSQNHGLAVATDGSQYVTGNFAGTLVLGGVSLTAGTGAGHIFLAKYSAAGAVLWAVKLDSPADLTANLEVDAAGNAYLAGNFATSLTLGAATLAAPGTDTEPYIVKYSAQGVVQWARQGGGPGSVAGIAADPGGNVTLAGHFAAAVNFGGASLTGGGVYCYKLSPLGNVLQSARIGSLATAQQSITPRDVALDAAGNTYMSGEILGNVSIGNIPLDARSRDLFLCKIDASGTVAWAVKDGGQGFDLAAGLVVDAGGNAVMGGRTDSSYANHGNLITLFRAYLARYTPQGSRIWRKVIPSGAPGGWINDVAHDGQGGYLVTGYLYGTLNLGNVQIRSEATGFMARFDSQGSCTWYTVPSTGDPSGLSTGTSMSGSGIAADAAGKVFVTGQIWGSGTLYFGALAPVGQGLFLGALQPGAVLATRPAPVPIPLAIYPNPATGFATLALPVGGGYLTVLDALGRAVREQFLPAGTGPAVVSLAGLAPGLYQLRIMLGNGQAARATLAVQ
jgi:hypothetical protein